MYVTIIAYHPMLELYNQTSILSQTQAFQINSWIQFEKKSNYLLPQPYFNIIILQ